VLGAGLLELLQAAAESAASAATDATKAARTRREWVNMLILHRVAETKCARCDTGGVERTALPPRTGCADIGQASGLGPFAGAVPLRDSAGFSPVFAAPMPSRGGSRDPVTLATRALTVGPHRAIAAAVTAAAIAHGAHRRVARGMSSRPGGVPSPSSGRCSTRFA